MRCDRRRAPKVMQNSKRCSGWRGPDRMRGVGLIEVMVSVLILAIGMLGIAAMQATALRNSQSALERSQGVINTYGIIDAMRANVLEARAGKYALARTCAVPQKPADSASLESKDNYFWLSNMQKNLGDGACGAITCTGSRCIVVVEWSDTRGSANVQALKFETEVVL